MTGKSTFCKQGSLHIVYYCTGLTSVTIPDSVTSIGNETFSHCTGLTSVIIPDSVTSIGWCAFIDCTSLTSIAIPDSVTSIGWCAFWNCTGLTAITVSADNQSYSSDSFGVLYNKSKTELIQYPCGNTRTSFTIPDSVTSIGDGAFWGCIGLTSVIIPDSVTSIGDSAFSDCTGLTSVTIPDSVTSIGYGAFYECTGLTSVTIPDSVTSIGNETFSSCTGLTSVSIPDSVTSIGWCAFMGCTSLTNIAIPDSVTSIGNYAFDNTGYYNNSDHWQNDVLYIGHYLIKANEELTGAYDVKPGTKYITDSAFFYCTGLTSITIPDSVTSIGGDVFLHCTGLTSITVAENNKFLSSDSFGVLYDKAKATLIQYPIGNTAPSFAVPNSVTSIGEYAFDNCTGLTSVTIPDSVTSIGDYAFYDCTGLTSVTIPDSVTSIGNETFRYCTGLTSVTIGNSVTSIGGSAFEDCTNLACAHIPASVTGISDLAFYNCENLAYICSDTADCYAKTYAEQQGIPFRVCSGNHPQPLPQHPQSAAGVSAECGKGAFDAPVSLLAQQVAQSELTHEFPQYEFALTGAAGEVLKTVYLIRPVDETGAAVQPNAGHKVTLRIPVPAGADYRKCRVCHVIDAAAQTTESFKWNPKAGSAAKPFTVSDDGKYFILEVGGFSPFIVFEEAAQVSAVTLSDATINYKAKTTLKPQITADEGAKYTVSYSSSNPNAVKVNEKTGEVTGAKRGAATITCTVKNDATGETVSTTCTVTVNYTVLQWIIIILLFGWIWY